MSYILDALKKSQAERQLGAVPTIDAAPIYGNAGPAPLNKPLWLALAALALLLALLLWRELHAPAVIMPVVPPDVPKVVQAPKAVAKVVEATKVANAPAAPKIIKAPEPTKAAKVVAPTPPVVASEPSVPALRELPEPIQRQIPTLAIGGYIYSNNPADRLLLVDKALRGEGDEVAPGLMLEKLQPAAAIFNFRGYRYRVPY